MLLTFCLSGPPSPEQCYDHEVNWSAIRGLARDWLVAIAVVFVIWLVWMRFVQPQPQSSGPAPEFSLSTLDGEVVAKDTHDDVVILNFWFTSCPPCRHEIPELAAYHRANPDVPLYGVSVDRMAPARLKAIAGKLGINYPVLHDLDTRVAADFGISLFPTTVILHKGEIASVTMGEVTEASLARAVDAIH